MRTVSFSLLVLFYAAVVNAQSSDYPMRPSVAPSVASYDAPTSAASDYPMTPAAVKPTVVAVAPSYTPASTGSDYPTAPRPTARPVPKLRHIPHRNAVKPKQFMPSNAPQKYTAPKPRAAPRSSPRPVVIVVEKCDCENGPAPKRTSRPSYKPSTRSDYGTSTPRSVRPSSKTYPESRPKTVRPTVAPRRYTRPTVTEEPCDDEKAAARAPSRRPRPQAAYPSLARPRAVRPASTAAEDDCDEDSSSPSRATYGAYGRSSSRSTPSYMRDHRYRDSRRSASEYGRYHSGRSDRFGRGDARRSSRDARHPRFGRPSRFSERPMSRMMGGASAEEGDKEAAPALDGEDMVVSGASIANAPSSDEALTGPAAPIHRDDVTRLVRRQSDEEDDVEEEYEAEEEYELNESVIADVLDMMNGFDNFNSVEDVDDLDEESAEADEEEQD